MMTGARTSRTTWRMLAAVRSAAVLGVDAYDVTVEVDCTRGLPQWTIVGMAAGSVKESRERVSSALANDLPGPGTIYLGQTLKFRCPVRIGDTVTVRLEVVEIIAEKRRARLSTVCRNQSGEVVLEGEATVLLPA